MHVDVDPTNIVSSISPSKIWSIPLSNDDEIIQEKNLSALTYTKNGFENRCFQDDFNMRL